MGDDTPCLPPTQHSTKPTITPQLSVLPLHPPGAAERQVFESQGSKPRSEADTRPGLVTRAGRLRAWEQSGEQEEGRKRGGKDGVGRKESPLCRNKGQMVEERQEVPSSSLISSLKCYSCGKNCSIIEMGLFSSLTLHALRHGEVERNYETSL